MPGHVFHPSHEELHGVTVVVETTGPRTYVGRYDSRDDRGVHMRDVGFHDPAVEDLSKDEYIRTTKKFGIKTQFKDFTVPLNEVSRIVRLAETL
jgi:hypothetical protein